MLNVEGKKLWESICSSDEYRAFKRKVRRTDKYACSQCKVKGTRGNRLHVHHMFPKAYHLELTLDPLNGTTVCKVCHIAIHKEYSNLGTFTGLPRASNKELEELSKTLKHTRRRYKRNYKKRIK